jgi:hypothetical protein
MDEKNDGLNLKYGTGDIPLQVTEYSPLPMIARALVFDYVMEHLGSDEERMKFRFDDVHVISFTYIMGNWKAIIGTSVADDTCFEVTYDSHDGVASVDAYRKYDTKKVAIPARRKTE